MEELRTCKLVKIYNRKKVVDRVSFYVRKGEIVGLLGPNGAGKTTIFHIIVGLVSPNEGRVILKNASQEIEFTLLPMYHRARLGIGYLSQEPSVFRKLTVAQNIDAILETTPLSRTEKRQRREELLSELRITHIANQVAYSLSGGERRRVEICRTLVNSPSFILLDEPFSGIDPLTVEDIQKIIGQLKEKGLGIVLTDHNVREIMKIVDRVYIIREGKILTEGEPKEVVKNELVRKIYLGETFEI
jgi:lipopolysaccharide export system ATP-binding protein